MNVPVLDVALIADLEGAVGAQGRDALLSNLADAIQGAFHTIRRLIESGDAERARVVAQSLRGSAASVGAYELMDCLLAVELYASQRSIDEVFLARFRGAADAVTSAARTIIGQSAEN